MSHHRACCCSGGGGGGNDPCFAHYIDCAGGFGSGVSIRYPNGCPPVHPPVIKWLAGDPNHRCFYFDQVIPSGSGVILQPAEIIATYQDCEECSPSIPPSGACCLPDGTCVNTTAAQCSAFGGTYQGDNLFCGDAPPCPQPTGACCRPDGTCNERTQASCQAGGGTWLGPNTTCTPNPCQQPVMHSCCIAGQCFNQDEPTCLSNGGLYIGPVQCGQGPACPGFGEHGPCCFAGGECVNGQTQAQCNALGGNWLGPAASCADCGTAPRFAAPRSRGFGDTVAKILSRIGVHV